MSHQRKRERARAWSFRCASAARGKRRELIKKGTKARDCWSHFPPHLLFMSRASLLFVVFALAAACAPLAAHARPAAPARSASRALSQAQFGGFYQATCARCVGCSSAQRSPRARHAHPPRTRLDQLLSKRKLRAAAALLSATELLPACTPRPQRDHGLCLWRQPVRLRRLPPHDRQLCAGAH
jgi:hypothetical protein